MTTELRIYYKITTNGMGAKRHFFDALARGKVVSGALRHEAACIAKSVDEDYYHILYETLYRRKTKTPFEVFGKNYFVMRAMRDFLRAAVFFLITPFFAALSIAAYTWETSF